jgi:hypothetical protein
MPIAIFPPDYRSDTVRDFRKDENGTGFLFPLSASRAQLYSNINDTIAAALSYWYRSVGTESTTVFEFFFPVSCLSPCMYLCLCLHEVHSSPGPLGHPSRRKTSSPNWSASLLHGVRAEALKKPTRELTTSHARCAILTQRTVRLSLSLLSFYPLKRRIGHFAASVYAPSPWQRCWGPNLVRNPSFAANSSHWNLLTSTPSCAFTNGLGTWLAIALWHMKHRHRCAASHGRQPNTPSRAKASRHLRSASWSIRWECSAPTRRSLCKKMPSRSAFLIPICRFT